MSERHDNQPPLGEPNDDFHGVSEPVEIERGEFQPSKPTRVAIWILAGMAFFLLGVLVDRSIFDQGRANDPISSGAVTGASQDDIDKIGTVLGLLEDQYYYQPEADAGATPFSDQLVNNAIDGMTAGLDDDYTVYLEPVEQAPIAEQMSGEYEGIGVWVDYPDGKVRIIAPMPGSPAEAAGL